MKKLFCLLLAAILVFGFTACGGSQNADSADDGWKFVKWTKNGEDFSEEPEITVEVAEGVEYMAVFETD